MKVLLTFDIEVWCNDWDQLDRNFPSSFERYVYGRSRHGQYALPQTLAILQRHGLRAVFFVEPLFAARFGVAPLREIVALIQAAGQEVQLHLHPEWTDEAREPLIDDCQRKRQHLSHYTRSEQAALIGHGLRLLAEAGAPEVTAFRAGSFAANEDTMAALAANQLWLDSSFNRCLPVSGVDMRSRIDMDTPFLSHGVSSYPLSVFRDGFGGERPAQVGACSVPEMAGAIAAAARQGRKHFLILSHNFEMLRPGSTRPDFIVVRRFEALCRLLAESGHEVGGFDAGMRLQSGAEAWPLPRVGAMATARRHAEQLLRRLP